MSPPPTRVWTGEQPGRLPGHASSEDAHGTSSAGPRKARRELSPARPSVPVMTDADRRRGAGEALRRHHRARRSGPDRRRGLRARAARPQRRREDHGGADPDHPARAPTPGGRRWSGLDVVRDADAGARLDRAHRPVRRGRRVPDRVREPGDGRPALPPAARREARSRAGELLERFDLTDAAQPAGQDLLRRHAPPARHRRLADRPAAGAVPRRADDRARPAQPAGHVGVHRRPRRRRDDDPAHHPVPGGGRPARRPDGGHRPAAGSSPAAPATS